MIEEAGVLPLLFLGDNMFNKQYREWKRNISYDAKKYLTPVTVQFELTSRCNFDCKMCYVHNQDSNRLKNKELSTEQWKNIMDQAFDNGMMFAVLTGGECLLREDFKELYLHLWNKGVFIMVLSNGFLFDDQMLAFFKEYPPEGIQFSIYGSSEEGYLHVTGHTGFSKVLASATKIIENKIPFTFALTCNSYIANDYISIIKFAKEHKYPLSVAELMILPKRDSPEETEHFLEQDDLVRLATEHRLIYGPVCAPEAIPDIVHIEGRTPSKGVTCTAGTSYAFITWEGNMYPCNALMECGGVSLLEMPFDVAWKETVQKASQILRPVECEGCAYTKACPKCIILRTESLYSGHCNPDSCELTKRLVAAGVKKLDKPQENDEDEFEY